MQRLDSTTNAPKIMKVWQASFYDAPDEQRSQQLSQIKSKSSEELLDWLQQGEYKESPRCPRLSRQKPGLPAIRGMVQSSSLEFCDCSTIVGVSDFLMAGLRPPPRRRCLIGAACSGVQNDDSGDASVSGINSNGMGQKPRAFPFGKPSPRSPSQGIAFPAAGGKDPLRNADYPNLLMKPLPRSNDDMEDGNHKQRHRDPNRVSQILGLPILDEDIFTAHAAKRNHLPSSSALSPRMNMSGKPKLMSSNIDSSDKRNLVMNEGIR